MLDKSYFYWIQLLIVIVLVNQYNPSSTSAKKSTSIFRQIRTSAKLWEPLKVTVPPCTAAGYIWVRIPNGAHRSVRGLLSIMRTADGNGTMNKLGTCFPRRNGHFYPKMLLFSAGNSAMNALRYWKRRNERSAMLERVLWMLRDVGNGAMNTPWCCKLRDHAFSDVKTCLNTLVALQRE